MLRPSREINPWFASEFIIGQGARESVAEAAWYSPRGRLRGSSEVVVVGWGWVLRWVVILIAVSLSLSLLLVFFLVVGLNVSWGSSLIARRVAGKF
jgi:hypothetical protein